MGRIAHPNGPLSVRTYGASRGSHDHGHFQVLVGLEGALELEVAGRGCRIGAGQGCVVPPGERHDFESRQGARCLVLDSHDSAWALAGTAPTPATLALASYLAEACSRGLPRTQTMGPALLLESWLPAPAAPRRARREIDWAALADWASGRWTEERVEVAELAARVHLSPAQFAARCREAFGVSTQQWLRGLQLDQARRLRAQGLPVAEAARRSGYRSPSALTAALRRRA
ncbi:MAG: helix-turn-helix domain-containing protein [Hydrogenophaga sp.]|uniref:AraC family transcriptional regulator n=1 Tax=Hydrogenophaga sp. TaxID=1904254 RepID=UPI0016B23B1A|nr:AraC family transcriptional regulator [Hydrogenophaga sp.]NIM43908.1 helix-turn-helix domain-containing protein [Hydrogenophaga sp.]NIN28974.1 helix-turn-helix domain-containing protein [Hydrogenophaga sp.]NIN33433.1 helix-turn-helix domain-containing protein [Hydrogenophaga sp.]NIN58108.1 helix-turn-helix domain-containing protein [Hydrogenophaga sp.]NIO54406.1 helix-turn-helix domain-containing protein [Hydrogenophaga sp.]